MVNYQQFLLLLDQWGLRDVLLPLIIIFTFTFAILQKLPLFGKKEGEGTAATFKPNKKINAIIAIGIALSSLTPHFTGRGFDVVIFMNNFLPNSLVLLFVVLLALSLIGTVSNISPAKSHPFIGLVAFVAVFALALILLQATQQINYPFLNFLNDPTTQAVVIVILVFVLIIWYITKKELTPAEIAARQPLKGLKDILEKAFGG